MIVADNVLSGNARAASIMKNSFTYRKYVYVPVAQLHMYMSVCAMYKHEYTIRNSERKTK